MAYRNDSNSPFMNALAFIAGLFIGIFPIVDLVVIIICVFTSGGNASNWFCRGVLTACGVSLLAGVIILFIILFG